MLRISEMVRDLAAIIPEMTDETIVVMTVVMIVLEADPVIDLGTGTTIVMNHAQIGVSP